MNVTDNQTFILGNGIFQQGEIGEEKVRHGEKGGISENLYMMYPIAANKMAVYVCLT